MDDEGVFSPKERDVPTWPVPLLNSSIRFMPSRWRGHRLRQTELADDIGGYAEGSQPNIAKLPDLLTR